MMIKQAGLFLKNSSRLMAGLSSVFAIMTFMIVASTSSVNAQSLVNGVDAVQVLKTEIEQLSNNNCEKAAPQGTSQEVASQMTELRCDFYKTVYSSMVTLEGAAKVQGDKSKSINHVNSATAQFKDRNPDKIEAINLLKSEIIDILRA